MTSSPSRVYINPSAGAWRHAPASSSSSSSSPSAVRTIHSQLPSSAPTPLRSLPTLARALGLGHVLLKDESRRYGLPSFKILGAAWAVCRAVAARVGLGLGLGAGGRGPGLAALGAAAAGAGVRLVTCTEGNWGRAVARMARLLGVGAVVYVPAHVPEPTRALIRAEGADVRVVHGDYDGAVQAARLAAREGEGDGALLVMDISWEGYTDVPEVGWFLTVAFFFLY